MSTYRVICFFIFNRFDFISLCFPNLSLCRAKQPPKMVNNVFISAVTTDNISRTELLAWVNDCLMSNFSKIEEMSSGAGYCQFTDILFPGKLVLKKVKFNGRSEVDFINNWNLLQTAWKKLGVEKPVPVERLLKAKFQDNFEFLLWFKKFFDANYDGAPYDPVAARGGEALPAGAKGPAKPTARAAPAARPLAARAPTAAAAPVARKPVAATAPTRVAPANGVASRPTAAAKMVVNKGMGAEQKLIEELHSQIQEYEERVAEYADSNVQLEKERDFYFEKLRKVEDMLSALEPGAPADAAAILEVLYMTEDGGAPEANDVDAVGAAEHEIENETPDAVVAVADELHPGDKTLEMTSKQISDDETF